MLPALFFFLSISLAILGLFWFHLSHQGSRDRTADLAGSPSFCWKWIYLILLAVCVLPEGATAESFGEHIQLRDCVDFSKP